MTTLRCTGKLLKRLGVRDPGEPPPAENQLGDWFANVIYSRRGHYILLVSERSLLPILTTARDLDNLVSRFIEQLADVLSTLDIPRNIIDHELSHMEPVFYGRTNSRVVLGSMNDFVQMFKYILASDPESGLRDLALHLAKAPCGPIGMKRPKDEARRLLVNPYGFGVDDGGAA